MPYRGWTITPGRLRELAGRYSTPWDRNAGGQSTSATETANVLRAWQQGNVLQREPRRAFYAYQQTGPHGVQCGLLAAVQLDSRLLPHEEVLPARCEEVAEILELARVNPGPVLLGHSGGAATAARVDEATRHAPTTEVLASDGQRHQVWRIDDRRARSDIAEELAAIPAFIADGHHRYIAARQHRRRMHAAGRGAGPWDHLSALLVDIRRTPLQLAPVHRVLPHVDAASALAAAADRFRVLRLRGELRDWLTILKRHAGPQPAFVVVTGREAYLLIDPDRQFLASSLRQVPTPLRHLHLTTLHKVLIAGLWGVPEFPEHVQFEDSAVRATERVRQYGGIAVLLNPPEQADLRDAAAAGVRLPSKATSFVPKPHPSLVFRTLDEQ
ncbi:DUF1015 domain-containing protein [Parasphingorhabdus pacifica]